MDLNSIIDPDWIVAVLGTIAALISAWYAITRIGIRPKITVQTSDGRKCITCKEGEAVTLDLEFENTGRAGIVRRDTLHEIAVAIYFPATYRLKRIERQHAKNDITFHAPQKGRFSGMDYAYVPDPFDRKPPVVGSLCHNEVEECKLEIVANHISTEGDEIMFDINAKEGSVLANSMWIRKQC